MLSNVKTFDELKFMNGKKWKTARLARKGGILCTFEKCSTALKCFYPLHTDKSTFLQVAFLYSVNLKLNKVLQVE